MRTAALVGMLILASSGAAARPGTDVNNLVPPGAPQLIMPSGMIDESPASPNADSPPVLNNADAEGSGTGSLASGSHHAQGPTYMFQSSGIGRIDVANLKIFGASIGGNGVYHGAVATLNWEY
jgi:hypothetical protein